MEKIVFYVCKHCGNVVYKPYDSKVPVVCCGEKMEVLKSNTKDAALEKHVPVIVQEKSEDGYSLTTVTVGEVIHPMLEEHYITFIVLLDEENIIFKELKAGDHPSMVAYTKGKVTAYEYCNLHGLWKGEQ